MYSKHHAWQCVPSTPLSPAPSDWEAPRMPYPLYRPRFTLSKNKVEPHPTRDIAHQSMGANLVMTPKTTSDSSVEDISLEASVLTPEEEFSVAFGKLDQDGLLDLQTLIGMLKEGNDTLSDEFIWEMIKEVVPAAAQDDAMVDCSQALLIFCRLRIASPDSQNAPSELGTSLVHHTPHKRSMCYLTLTVVGLMLVVAIFIAGLSVMWLFFSTQSQNEWFLGTDLNLTQDMLQGMVRAEFQSRQESLALLVTQTVATLVEEMGYRMNYKMGRDALSAAIGFLGAAIDEWWKEEARQNVLSATALMGTWIEGLINSFGLATAVQLVDKFNNSTLPDGIEILLAQWADPSNMTMRFLTKLRFKDECLNGNCGSLPSSAILTRNALSGKTGTMRGYDYRPHMVQGGFMYLPSASVGLVYKMDIEVVQDVFVKKIAALFDAFNALSDAGRELQLGRTLPNGTRKILSKMRNCDVQCMSAAEKRLQTANTSLARSLAGQTGLRESKDVLGNDVLAAFTNISAVSIGIVIRVVRSYYKQSILEALGGVLNVVNAKLEGSQELELATSDIKNGTLVVRNLTQQKFSNECQQGMCTITDYMQEAAEDCSSGVNHSTDYRGGPVIVGYLCMPKITAYLAYKVDESEVIQEGLELAVQSANALNDGERDSTFELEIGRVKDGTPFANYTLMPEDVEMLSRPRFEDSCPDDTCNIGSTLLGALRQQKGVVHGNDYRGKEVMAATSFMSSMGIGLVNKVDMAQLLRPVIETALMLLGVSLGSLAACSYLLAVYTRLTVSSMVRAEKEGQDAIVREKERFSTLVQSMYPSYVIGRMLAGDKQIVEKLPHAAVFFSDIHDFTSTAYRISAEELLQLMGYIYGVMDQISDRFNITKVKTVGDAYLAICGLPGSESTNCCVDMLHFASCCAEIFSSKFHHPTQGAVLALLTKRQDKKSNGENLLARVSVVSNAINSPNDGQPLRSPSSKNHETRSVISSAHTSSKGQKEDLPPATPNVQCVMSYGIAAGPVTAGVLQGKSPMFDIWGKTVNLASRMQSTGLPGRIQVSELFYKSVINVPSLGYTFEKSHSVMCKGFGLLKSYYVKSSKNPPPKDLQLKLGLEPNLGTYHYVNLAPGPQKHEERGNEPHAKVQPVSDSNAQTGVRKTSAYVPAIPPPSIRVQLELVPVSPSLSLLDA